MTSTIKCLLEVVGKHDGDEILFSSVNNLLINLGQIMVAQQARQIAILLQVKMILHIVKKEFSDHALQQLAQQVRNCDRSEITHCADRLSFFDEPCHFMLPNFRPFFMQEFH